MGADGRLNDVSVCAVSGCSTPTWVPGTLLPLYIWLGVPCLRWRPRSVLVGKATSPTYVCRPHNRVLDVHIRVAYKKSGRSYYRITRLQSVLKHHSDVRVNTVDWSLEKQMFTIGLAVPQSDSLCDRGGKQVKRPRTGLLKGEAPTAAAAGRLPARTSRGTVPKKYANGDSDVD